MERFFNVAGICRPDKHYMIEPEGRLAKLRPLIDREAWFVVHAPRQSGKTTSAQLLAEALTAEGTYAAVLASCKPGAVAGNDGGSPDTHSPCVSRSHWPASGTGTDCRLS